MVRLLSWWHLSDLHIPVNKSGDLEDIAESFPQAIRKDQDRNGLNWQPNFIFFTGDVAKKGCSDEYRKATDFFDDLLDTFGLGKECLFVVPGNHDFDRESVRPGDVLTKDFDEKTQKLFASQKKIGRDITSDEAHDGKIDDAYFAPLKNYNEWCASFFENTELTFSKDKQFYVCFRDLDRFGLRVAVVGLNTALNSYERINDESEQGHIVIGNKTVKDIIKKLEDDPPDFTYVLGHHPLNWISEKEASIHIGARIREISDSSGGHVHEYGILKIIKDAGSYGLNPFFELTSGALNQKNPILYPNTAVFGELFAQKPEDLLFSNNPQIDVQIDFKTFTYFTTSQSFCEDGNENRVIPLVNNAKIMRNAEWDSLREKKLIHTLESKLEHEKIGSLDLSCAKLLPDYSEISSFQERPERGTHNSIELIQTCTNSEEELKCITNQPSCTPARILMHCGDGCVFDLHANNEIRLVTLPQIIEDEHTKLILNVSENPPMLGDCDLLYQYGKTMSKKFPKKDQSFSNIALKMANYRKMIQLEEKYSLANVAIRMGLIYGGQYKKEKKYIVFQLRKDSDRNTVYKNTWDAGVVGHIHLKHFQGNNPPLYEAVLDKLPRELTASMRKPTIEACDYFNIIREFPLGDITIIGRLTINNSKRER